MEALLGLLLLIIGTILGAVWLFVPLAIFDIKVRLDRLILETKQTNSLLQRLVDIDSER